MSEDAEPVTDEDAGRNMAIVRLELGRAPIELADLDALTGKIEETGFA